MRHERERRPYTAQKPELSRQPGTPSGLFRIYGRRPVLEALKLGVVKSLEITSQAHGQIIEEILLEAEARSIPVKRATQFELEEEAVTQGVTAYAIPPRVRSDLRRFLEELPESPPPLLLMLDGITDPHNFGAILRTAEGAGVNAVIIREHRQVSITDTVIKASAGAAYFTPVYEVVNLAQTLRLLKETGFWSVAAVGGEESRNYWDYDWQRPTVLVIGAEGAGVSTLLRREADERVAIPMLGRIESLNVSVATGVLLFEASKKRTSE